MAQRMTLFSPGRIEPVLYAAVVRQRENPWCVDAGDRHSRRPEQSCCGAISFRLSRRARAEKEGRLKDARTILEIILLPQLDLHDADGNHSYASFLSQYLLQGRFPEFGDFSGSEAPHLTRALRLLRERVDYLPPYVAQRRLISISLMFLNILVRHHGTDHADFGESFESALEDTMEQIVMVMSMPLRLGPQRR